MRFVFLPTMLKKQHVHFKLHKPYGMLSQMTSNDAKELRTKRFLSELYDFPDGVMPIGRLDEKSEGLLLMTTNGKLADTINRSGIEKEYLVQLDGEITGQAINELQKGVEIGIHGKKYLTKPCIVNSVKDSPVLFSADQKIRIGTHRPNSWFSITLTEGKFRQIRKMTAAVGFPTLRLIRIRIGNVVLNDLAPETVESLDDLLI